MFRFWGEKSTEDDLSSMCLKEIFPLQLRAKDFLRSDVAATYSKILSDTVERVHGISDKQIALLFDNTLQSEQSDGLITLISKAMAAKSDLFLVYKLELNVIREADRTEEAQIRADYKKLNKSSVGYYLSFRNYDKTDMLRIYSALEYCVLASLNKTLNVSKSLQVKVKDLRGAVGLVDSAVAIAQARSIAKALGDGNDTMLDAGDEIVGMAPDTSSSEKALLFLDGKKAFILGLPLSYISGAQTPGIGASGEGDTKAIERGLRHYFITILKPVLDALFNVTTTYKSTDFRQLTSALETLKAFDLASDNYLSVESKREILARLFELDIEDEAERIEEESENRAAEEPVAPPLQITNRV